MIVEKIPTIKRRHRSVAIFCGATALILPTAYPNLIGWVRGGLSTQTPAGSYSESAPYIGAAVDFYDNSKIWAFPTFGHANEVSVNGRTCPGFPGSGNNYLRGNTAIGHGYMFTGTFTMFLALNNVTSGYIVQGNNFSASDNGSIWLVVNSSVSSTFYAIDNTGNTITCTINEDLTGNGKIVVLQYSGNTLTAYVNGNTYTGTNASFTNTAFNSYLSFMGFWFRQTMSGYGVYTMCDWFTFTDTKSSSDINAIVNNYIVPSYNFSWTNI